MTASLPATEDLPACATEPIQWIGAIQPHGAMLCIDPQTLICTAASENVADYLTFSHEDLLGRDMRELLAPDQTARLVELIGEAMTHNVAHRLNVQSRSACRALDVSAFRTGSYVALEFEPSSGLTTEPIVFATRLARLLDQCTTVADVLSQIVDSVSALVGSERTMVYRFHKDNHGEVVAESCRPDVPTYLGHHFPASDIPQPARMIYRMVPFRTIVDRRAQPAMLRQANNQDPVPIDLTRSGLRAAAPIHLKYMANMGDVGSSSFPMFIDERLEYLVSCTSREVLPIPLGYRLACSQVVRYAAARIAAINARTALTQRSTALEIMQILGSRAESARHLPAAFAGGDSLALDLVGADGLAYSIGGNQGHVGRVPAGRFIVELVDEGRERAMGNVWASDNLRRDVPNAQRPPIYGGALVLQFGTTGDYLVWFRDELTVGTTWLGNPHESDPTGLSPRSSFASWVEASDGRSAPWSDSTLESASQFGLELDVIRARIKDAHDARLANVDPLTGLLNRRGLRQAVADAHRLADSPVAAVVVDVDDFKSINDSFGHAMGDQVLAEVARRLRKVRSRGIQEGEVGAVIAARAGGDEFIIAVIDADPDHVADVADHAETAFADPFYVGNQVITVAASVGHSLAREGEAFADVVARADLMMYGKKAVKKSRADR